MEIGIVHVLGIEHQSVRMESPAQERRMLDLIQPLAPGIFPSR